jgi:energy-coupling factor transporter ATP-binding protein EcfA2
VNGLIILQGKHLKKSYITDLIFENVDFVVQEGEKVGLVGPNGTGKSTLFRCITGEESFDDGQIQMSARHTMGYMEQMPEFAPGFTLLDAVLEMFQDIFAMRDKLRHLEHEMGTADGDALEHLLEEYSQLTHSYEDLGGFSCESRAKGIIKGLGFNDCRIKETQPAFQLAVKLVDGSFYFGKGCCNFLIRHRPGGVDHKQNIHRLTILAKFIEIRQKEGRLLKPAIRRGERVVIYLFLHKFIEDRSPIHLGIPELFQQPLRKHRQSPTADGFLSNGDRFAGFRKLLHPYVP